MINIRPNQVFRAVDVSLEPFWFQLPGRGGLLTLESTILVALLKLVEAKNAFEFGTYKGFTTRLLLENIEGSGTLVTTLDLPTVDQVSFEGSDRRLAIESLTDEREYRRSVKSDQVAQVLMDSLRFSAENFGKFDFIFVDGNHKISYARHDTEEAFKLVADQGCIAWHDYRNPEFPELTAFLDDLSSFRPLYHVEETMLCFYLPGRSLPQSIGDPALN